MGFWIIVAALALLSLAILAVAVLRGRPGAEPAAAYDLRVYRDQLKELDRDLARGVVAGAEAEQTRTEIARRILAADAQMQKGSGQSANTPGRRMLIAVLGLAVVGGSFGLYATIGAPGYGDLPRSLREANAAEIRAERPPQSEAEANAPAFPPSGEVSEEYHQLVDRLRATVEARPDDLQGHVLLAQNEALLGNYAAAHAAQAGVLRIRGDQATGRDYANYADLMILAAGGYVSAEAEAALSEALKRQPTNGTAQYYWGLMYAQTGRPDLAFRIWQRLLAAGPPDAVWIPPIRGQIENIAMLAGESRFVLPPEQPLPGPSAEDMEAASDMTDADREDMIRGMVDRLAERLAGEGGSAGEWARLIRALGVLGETARATAIRNEALQVFSDDPGSVAAIEAAARDAGLSP